MSGGTWDYWQYHIEQIANDIDDVILKNKKPIPYKNLDKWDKERYDPQNPPLEYDFSNETIEEFKRGAEALRKAFVYAQRIDWLLSGDDGEESFHERLKEELDKLRGGKL